jgi:hypothetical protein
MTQAHPDYVTSGGKRNRGIARPRQVIGDDSKRAATYTHNELHSFKSMEIMARQFSEMCTEWK